MAGTPPGSVRWQRAEDGDKVRLLTPEKDAPTPRINGTLSDEDPDSEADGEPARATLKTPAIVYVISFFSIIGGFLFGYDTGVIAGALLELDADFDLDATRKELVVSITVAAAALGALCGAVFNERLGRKRTIMVASAIFFVGAVVMAAAPTAPWGWVIVLAGRFIVGIGIGLASMTVPIYLAECAPVHLRGRLTVADNMAITAGQFVAAVIDYGFSYVGQGWRFMLGLAAIPAAVRFVAFFFLPESPRWLVTRGRREAARGVLLRLRRDRGASQGDVQEAVDRELREIQENLEGSARENAHSIPRKLWIMLTTRHLLMALVVGCGIQIIQQLSGINTVMYYAPTILHMAGVRDNHTAIGLGAVVAFGNFIFTLIGLYLVEKSGRRKLVLSSLAGVVVSLVLLGLAFYLTNSVSPPAFAPANIDANDTASGGECIASSRACSTWKNCDDCVINDECNYCVFNGSFGSSEAVGLCVSSSDSTLYHNRHCTLPDDFISYTTGGSDECHSLEAANVTVETFGTCPNAFSWLTLATLVTYIVSFSPGMGPVPWTVNAEIYPNWARSVGNSVATTANWASNLLVSITFLHLTRYLTRFGAFWLYSVIAACGWVFLFLLLPETKGRSLEDAEELFQRPLCPPPGISSAADHFHMPLRPAKRETEVEPDT
jgi:SP family myo-inositol transporter-like MFS transporter 13